MSVRPRSLRSLPRSVALLAATSLFGDISTEMLYPVLPVFLTRDLGAPATVVGIVEGVAEATQNIVQGASGWVADRIGRNKPVALVGYALAAGSKPLIGVAVAWPQVLGGRFVDRLGTGIRSAPRDALIASSVDASWRGAAFGLEGLGDNLGAVIGPLVAAAMLYLLHADLRLVFFVAFVPGLIAFSLITQVREPARPSGPRVRLSIRSLPRAYWRYLAAVAAFGIGSSSRAFIILRAGDVGLEPEQTLLAYAGFNLVAALSSFPAGDASDRWGRGRVLVAAFGIFAAAYAGLAVAATGPAVVALLALYGVFYGAFRAVGKALAADLVPPALRASGVGFYGATVGLSTLIASVVAGQLWDRLGPAATFTYGAACAVLGAALLVLLLPKALSARTR